MEDHCRAILDAAQEDIAEADPSIEVTRRTYIGPAITALIEESGHADTVVVGSRRRRTLPAFLLGATSLEVAAHAACPAVVVRERADAHSGRVVVGVDGTPRSSEPSPTPLRMRRPMT